MFGKRSSPGTGAMAAGLGFLYRGLRGGQEFDEALLRCEAVWNLSPEERDHLASVAKLFDTPTTFLNRTLYNFSAGSLTLEEAMQGPPDGYVWAGSHLFKVPTIQQWQEISRVISQGMISLKDLEDEQAP